MSVLRAAHGTRDAVWGEVLKARRSRLPAITALVFALVPGVAALFTFIAQDPGRARSLGLLGAKAELNVAEATWPAHFQLLAQIVAVGGLIVFGIVLIWIFGREFGDSTAKDLLALPVPRTAIVTAKILVSSCWCLLLAIQMLVLGILAVVPLRLPGWSTQVLVEGAGTVLATAAWTVVLALSFALAACLGRGYLAAVATMFAVLFCSQILASLGYGRYFPYSVPSLGTGATGDRYPPPGCVGYGLVLLLGAGSWAALALWWQRADHHR